MQDFPGWSQLPPRETNYIVFNYIVHVAYIFPPTDYLITKMSATLDDEEVENTACQNTIPWYFYCLDLKPGSLWKAQKRNILINSKKVWSRELYTSSLITQALHTYIPVYVTALALASLPFPILKFYRSFFITWYVSVQL